MPSGLPFKLTDYLDLVDITGRTIREDKRGYIDQKYPAILKRLNIEPEKWLELAKTFEEQFKVIAGSQNSIETNLEYFCYTRKPNLTRSRRLFG